MRALLGTIVVIAGVTILAVLLASRPVAAVTNHIVISEIQASGGVADDEFVELYNPTDATVDLAGWRLRRRNGAGAEGNLVASMSGSIAPRGYFLVAHPSYDGAVVADQIYSATTSAMTSNVAVLLYQDAGVTLVDKVGFGTASDFEASPAAAPAANGSIERKPGEAGPVQGNDQDTNDNSADFAVRLVAEPQNSLSAIEPALSPTLTPTVSPSPEPTATPTFTPTPTEEPTTPSPTPITTPTPTSAEPSPTPSPTPESTATPTSTPAPTIAPTVTPTTTPSSSPSPTVTLAPTPTSTLTPTPPHFPGTVFPLRVFLRNLFLRIMLPFFRS